VVSEMAIEGTKLPFPPGPWDAELRAASVLHADEVPFRVLLMAAMMKCADPAELRILAWGFPALAGYLSGRGYPIPLERAPVPSGLEPVLGADLEEMAEQLRDAMGLEDPAWAPLAIQLVRRRHPGLWDDALATVKESDRSREEM
jgi:hypothetical protein